MNALGSKYKLMGRALGSLAFVRKHRGFSTMIDTALMVMAAGMTVLTLGLSFPSVARAQAEDEFITFTVDVTQDANTNGQIDVNPAEGPTLFARGDVYVVDGNLYKAGTIESGQPKNDPNAPGAIGKYRIRGVMLGNTGDFERAIAGDKAAMKSISFATEIFSFPDDQATIITEGDWPNAFFSVRRPVIGGTGRFAGVVGEAYEQNIGENMQGFCNLRVTFKIRKASLRGGQNDR